MTQIADFAAQVFSTAYLAACDPSWRVTALDARKQLRPSIDVQGSLKALPGLRALVGGAMTTEAVEAVAAAVEAAPADHPLCTAGIRIETDARTKRRVWRTDGKMTDVPLDTAPAAPSAVVPGPQPMKPAANDSASTETAAPAAAALAGSESADARTVFATPIHFKASEAQIAAFFSAYGRVEAVERRTYVEFGVVKPRSSVFIVFATEAEARACVAARPQYGAATTELGTMFVPTLRVSLKDNAADAVAAEEQRRTAGAAAARRTADSGVEAPAETAAAGAVASHRLLASRGCILVARGLAPATRDGDVHSRLGGLALRHQAVRRAIDVVSVAPPAADAATATGYIYCTSRAAAGEVLAAYARALNEPVGASLRVAVPTLERCEGDEETAAMERYPPLVAARTAKKMAANARQLAAKRRDREGSAQPEGEGDTGV